MADARCRRNLRAGASQRRVITGLGFGGFSDGFSMGLAQGKMKERSRGLEWKEAGNWKKNEV